MAARYRIELLGTLRVLDGDRETARFRTQKTGALLAYLAYHLDDAHPREVLLELLWPWKEPRKGRQSLRTALSSLRRQLEPPGVPAGAIIEANRSNVRLNRISVTTDVAEFRRLLGCAESAGSSAERAIYLSDAVDLYQGVLLPGYYEDWILPEQERLAELYFGAVKALTGCLIEAGETQRMLDCARRAVSLDPLRAEAHHLLMRLLAAAGQIEAALRQYERLEEMLEKEYGQQPSAEARRLVRRMLAGRGSAPDPDGEFVSQAAPLSAPEAATVPTGTVTFLLTDIEGSTRLGEEAPSAFQEALASHHQVLRDTFEHHGGHEVRELGDGFTVAFERAGDALACAVAGQEALVGEAWPQAGGDVRVRMALHTGHVQIADGEYRGLALNHAARILATAHGGQIVCSESTATLARRELASGVWLVHLGIYQLRDVKEPERLFQVSYPGMPQREFPPLNAEAGYQDRLPITLTRFFGREEELAQVQEFLLSGETRMATVIGPGGSGKTRLAIEVGRQLLDEFQGAVWFVPLQDLGEAGLITAAVADALGLPRSPHIEPLDQAVELLSRQPSLVILDNFEHLTDEGVPVVRELLERAPTAKYLVTSRQCLNLNGEVGFFIAPLPTPSEVASPEELMCNPSIQLFVDRAQLARPDFQLTEGNAQDVAELCGRLEGIPLAIELAAARAQVMTPAQMVGQLGDRFDLLVGRKRDMPDRHRTLAAALDWSYRLLSPELQRFFARLSVFRGGWTLEAAQTVCDEPRALDYLEQLRDSSMVVSDEVGGEIRYRMLETLREYGRAQVGGGEWADLCLRHAEHFASVALAAQPSFEGDHERATRVYLLGVERGNFRAALEWCAGAANGAALGLRLAAALWDYWLDGPHKREGENELRRFLALTEGRASPTTRAKALHGLGTITWYTRGPNGARAYLEEALAIRQELGEGLAAAVTLNALGNLSRPSMGGADLAAAEECYERALQLRRDAGDRLAMTHSMGKLAWVAVERGDYETARQRFEEQLALRRELGDDLGAAYCYYEMGVVACRQGNLAEAEELHSKALAIRREQEDWVGVTSSCAALGDVAQRQGRAMDAIGRFEEAAGLCREWDLPYRETYLCQLARLTRHVDAARARSYAEEACAILDQRAGEQADGFVRAVLAEILSSIDASVRDESGTAASGAEGPKAWWAEPTARWVPWAMHTEGAEQSRDHSRAHSGRSSLRLASTGAACEGVNSWMRTVLDAKPGRYELAGFVSTQDVSESAKVAACVQCRNADREMVEFATTSQVPGQFAGTRDWTRISVEFEAPEGTVEFIVFAMLVGEGTVWFDDVELVPLPDQTPNTP